MKLLKAFGIILALAALICAIGVVGRAETDDRLYSSGEITAEEMLSTEQLLKYALIFGAVGLVGTSCWAVGTCIEAGQAEKRYKRYYGRVAERGIK